MLYALKLALCCCCHNRKYSAIELTFISHAPHWPICLVQDNLFIFSTYFVSYLDSMAFSRKKIVTKAAKDFKINDVVFAKLTGFAKWPAQIYNIDGRRYTVVFFGSYDW